jgi:hypothetical protein
MPRHDAYALYLDIVVNMVQVIFLLEVIDCLKDFVWLVIWLISICLKYSFTFFGTMPCLFNNLCCRNMGWKRAR